MGRKKLRKPIVRRRTKPTTGQLQFTNVVYMDREKVDGKVRAFGVCTCNEWRSSEDATTITKVGLEAKAHVEASDGKCAFRFHEIPEEMKEGGVTADTVEEIREELESVEFTEATTKED